MRENLLSAVAVEDAHSFKVRIHLVWGKVRVGEMGDVFA